MSRGVDQLSQVRISPPAPRGGQKICGLNDTGTKKMWVKKFKSPIVTRTNRVGRIFTRTKRGWTKRQGTQNIPLRYVPSRNAPLIKDPIALKVPLRNIHVIKCPETGSKY